MTGFKSKKAAAQDKMAHLTLEQRCRLSEQCLPDAPYRAMLIKLHDEMLAARVQRTWVDLTENEIEVIEKRALSKQWAIRMTMAQLREKNT